ncbi:MAG: D-erythronate dehydrogenase [Pseudomonadota bacterium]|nr:D-erythronate dehydrogenase [Pseudomonadota bacterium]
MKIVITGGTGFIGRRLALKLLEKNDLDFGRGQGALDSLVAFDIGEPDPPFPDDPRLEIVSGDATNPEQLRALITPDTDAIFHLAAVVSAGAEADFDLGMRVNLGGTRTVLDICRELGTQPRVVFASSVAVFGGLVPEVIQDDTHLNPQTSYGAQKASSELLINDYSRKGFVDGRALRLPTVVVRPGKPNKAASTFASSIIREPLQGSRVNCPVSEDQAMWLLSPRRVVDAFIHAAEMPAEAWGPHRAVSIPGITHTVREMVDALTDVAGLAISDRIDFKPDADIRAIVSGWPMKFAANRGRDLGFEADSSMQEIIEAFIEDELGGDFVR